MTEHPRRAAADDWGEADETWTATRGLPLVRDDVEPEQAEAEWLAANRKPASRAAVDEPVGNDAAGPAVSARLRVRVIWVTGIVVAGLLASVGLGLIPSEPSPSPPSPVHLAPDPHLGGG